MAEEPAVDAGQSITTYLAYTVGGDKVDADLGPDVPPLNSSRLDLSEFLRCRRQADLAWPEFAVFSGGPVCTVLLGPSWTLLYPGPPGGYSRLKWIPASCPSPRGIPAIHDG